MDGVVSGALNDGVCHGKVFPVGGPRARPRRAALTAGGALSPSAASAAWARGRDGEELLWEQDVFSHRASNRRPLIRSFHTFLVLLFLTLSTDGCSYSYRSFQKERRI